jgi:hypothetical protein
MQCRLTKNRTIIDPIICKLCRRKCEAAGNKKKEIFIMKTGICAECGTEKPLKAKGLCRTCYNRSRKKMTAEAEAPKRPVVLLDFTGREGLFEELKGRAQKEFRPLEWQIMRDLDMEAHHAA